MVVPGITIASIGEMENAGGAVTPRRMATEGLAPMASKAYPVLEWAHNIRSAYDHASEQDRIAGHRWYADARQFTTMRALAHGITIGQVADLISVLSPQKAWSQNLEEVDRFLNAYSAGEDLDTVRAFCTRLQRAKIRSILECGDGLRGPKVTSFRTNILDPWSDAVTVDSWAVRVALGEPSHDGSISSDTLYQAYVDAYRIVGNELGMMPSALQAIVWIHYRRLYGKHHAVRREFATA